MSVQDRDAADAVYRALLSRVGEAEPHPGIESTRRALEFLGDPQHAIPVIHVTGTNGKTSTSRMIESMLRSHGLRTGLFTSPHVDRFTERIAIDGEAIADADIARLWSEVEPFIELADSGLLAEGGFRLTFFEALTVLAFACFADAPVDVVILEVGMGGLWDSTNVADAQVAVFTPIDLDHGAQLGRTIAEVARTKAGIIKAGSRVVTAEQPAIALAEIQSAAAAHDARVSVAGEDFALESDVVAVGGQMIAVRGRAARYDELLLPLYGRHQARNAALAIAAVEEFLGGGEVPLDAATVTDGLLAARSPGRLQLIASEPSVLLDAAHNPHGAQALAAALPEFFDFDGVALVIGVLEDKDARGVLRALGPVATELFLTRSDSERALPVDTLQAVAAAELPEHTADGYDRLDDALEAAHAWAAAGEKRAVLVTGSITLLAEARDIADDRGWTD